MAGLDDLLGGLLGGASSGGQGTGGLDLSQLQSMVGPAMEAINQNGGISGVLEKLQSSGLGDVVSSWLGQGANSPISADQLSSVLGSDTINNIAGASGLSADQISSGLSSVLPSVVDQASPNGQLDVSQLQNMLGGLLGGK
jgi:hypothetical protein